MTAGLPTEDLEDLYENAPCGYLSLDGNGRIVKANRTLATWLGVAPEALLGRRLLDLLNVAGAIFYETHFAPLLRMQGHFQEVALDFQRADGTTIPALANAAERRADGGTLLFTRVTIFKASDRRRYERDLVEARNASDKARRELEQGLLAEREASELREQFVAVLGHDLRNPLAAIDAGLRALQSESLSARGANVTQLMRSSIARMSGLIDNVLDLARSRLGGGIVVRLRQGDLAATVLQVVAELQSAHPDCVIETGMNIVEEPAVDHGRFAQLLSNLLGNALAHGTPGQPVRVDLVVSGGELVLSIANQGEPIPPDVLPRLFQPFSRGDDSPDARGLGLGLFIASEIAGAHHGRIDVISDVVETRFTFTMPVRRP